MAANTETHTVPPPGEDPEDTAVVKLTEFTLNYTFRELITKRIRQKRAILQIASEKKDGKLYRLRKEILKEILKEISEELENDLARGEALLTELEESSPKQIINEYVNLARQVLDVLCGSIYVLEHGSYADFQELANAWSSPENDQTLRTMRLCMEVSARELRRHCAGGPSAYERIKSTFKNLRETMHGTGRRVEAVKKRLVKLKRTSKATVSRTVSGSRGGRSLNAERSWSRR